MSKVIRQFRASFGRSKTRRMTVGFVNTWLATSLKLKRGNEPVIVKRRGFKEKEQWHYLTNQEGVIKAAFRIESEWWAYVLAMGDMKEYKRDGLSVTQAGGDEMVSLMKAAMYGWEKGKTTRKNVICLGRLCDQFGKVQRDIKGSIKHEDKWVIGTSEELMPIEDNRQWLLKTGMESFLGMIGNESYINELEEQLSVVGKIKREVISNLDFNQMNSEKLVPVDLNF